MAEYIKRDDLLQDISETVVFTVRKGAPLPNAEMRGANKVIDRIKSAPTADVVEVRNGEWLHTEEPLGWRDVDCIECSSCHESWIMDDDLCLDDYKDGWKYCPHCGAKMNGVTDANVGGKMDGKGDEQ